MVMTQLILGLHHAIPVHQPQMHQIMQYLEMQTMHYFVQQFKRRHHYGIDYNINYMLCVQHKHKDILILILPCSY